MAVQINVRIQKAALNARAQLDLVSRLTRKLVLVSTVVIML